MCYYLKKSANLNVWCKDRLLIQCDIKIEINERFNIKKKLSKTNNFLNFQVTKPALEFSECVENNTGCHTKIGRLVIAYSLVFITSCLTYRESELGAPCTLYTLSVYTGCTNIPRTGLLLCLMFAATSMFLLNGNSPAVIERMVM